MNREWRLIPPSTFGGVVMKSKLFFLSLLSRDSPAETLASGGSTRNSCTIHGQIKRHNYK